MSRPPIITDVVVTQAPRADQALGLFAYLRFRLDDLVLDGITLRRTRDGRLTLAWPERTDSAGRRHAVVRPAGDAERVALEQAVFDALDLPAELRP